MRIKADHENGGKAVRMSWKRNRRYSLKCTAFFSYIPPESGRYISSHVNKFLLPVQPHENRTKDQPRWFKVIILSVPLPSDQTMLAAFDRLNVLFPFPDPKPCLVMWSCRWQNSQLARSNWAAGFCPAIITQTRCCTVRPLQTFWSTPMWEPSSALAWSAGMKLGCLPGWCGGCLILAISVAWN